MRASIYMLLLLLVLLTPFVLRRALNAAPAVTQTTNGDELVIATPHSPDIRREFARAFSAWHVEHYGSPVTLDFRAMAGTSDIKRILQTNYDSVRLPDHTLPPEDQIASTINIQIAWGGGNLFFDTELKQLGILDQLHLSPAQIQDVFPRADLAGVDLYDREKDGIPRWVGVCLSSFGIMYNPDMYRQLGLDPPQTWSDLTNPKLIDNLGLTDPTHSGSVMVCYMMVLQRAMADAETEFLKTHAKSDAGYDAAISAGFSRGMATLLLIAANGRYFTDSSNQTPLDVSDGQAAAAVTIDFYARIYGEQVGGDRAKFVTPVNATAITPDPVAILYGTAGRKRELADHFVEFLLSPAGQRLWILKAGAPGGPIDRSLRRPPIRFSVYAEDKSNWADPEVNPFKEAGSFNLRGAWMAFSQDIRPIWAAAWIDDRDALLDAYSHILAVHDDSRRQTLLDELSHLPVTLDDVRADGVTRKTMESSTNGDQWKAQHRIDWASKFQEFYNRIGAEAHD